MCACVRTHVCSSTEHGLILASDTFLSCSLYYLLVCCGCGCRAREPVWRSKGPFVEWVFSFNLYMGSRNQTQAARLLQQAPLPTQVISLPTPLFEVRPVSEPRYPWLPSTRVKVYTHSLYIACVAVLSFFIWSLGNKPMPSHLHSNPSPTEPDPQPFKDLFWQSFTQHTNTLTFWGLLSMLTHGHFHCLQLPNPQCCCILYT